MTGVLDGDERPALVVGASAIGLLLQYLLQASARSTLVARQESWERLQAQPLRITGELEATQYVRCRTWETLGELDPLVTVFVATRAREVPAVLTTLKPRLAKHATVVLCQDGIGVFRAANEVLPKTRLVRLASWLAAERWEPDHLHVAGLGRLDLAGDPGDGALLAHWRDMLSHTGLQTTVAYDPHALEWRKGLVAIASHALSALTEAKNGALLDSAELRSVVAELVEEAAAAAKTEGVRLSAHDRAAVFQSLEASRGCVSEALLDLRAGRRPELDFSNGAVVEAARRHGEKAPVNEAVLALVEFLDKCGRWHKHG
ncbi:MAG TPA: 2-dehydropantoate 2-reductase [Thermoanaerobaculia bacterium]|nr:2-dehydropantoate 2-reductase [Thermoanaerobaculia bacterium]